MNKKIKFKPREWKTSIDANCYMYALNYRKRKLDDVGKISGLESKDYYDIEGYDFHFMREDACNR